MGYHLTSLGNLPLERGITLYIFVINGRWRGGHYETLEQNFSEIAQSIGPNAIIVRGFEEALFSAPLCEKYLGKDYGDLLDVLPAVLLSDTHPEELHTRSLRLLIPLREAESEFGDLQSFFRSLAKFARDQDQAFLDRFREARDWIEEGNSVIDLRPNLFGIGVNLNEFIRKLRRRDA